LHLQSSGNGRGEFFGGVMSVDFGSELAARLSLEAFDRFSGTFRTITRRSQQRFEQRDWAGGRWDAIERLDAYENALDKAVDQLVTALGERTRDPHLWVGAKECFASLVAQRYDIDRAETFFNSVTRKMLRTVGVNRAVEFFYLHPKHAHSDGAEPVYRTYTRMDETVSVIRSILLDTPFRIPLEDIDRDAALIAQEIDLFLFPILHALHTFAIEMVRGVFYRNKIAYLIGRIVLDERVIPLILPMANGPSGIRADALLLRNNEASILFSFAYAYFSVDVERYDALIEFLRSILPDASLAELYTSLGYNRHGKTEFYRDLHRFVHLSQEQFVIAPGLEGAVMIVFTLPDFDFVFKVIKDRPCFLRSSLETSKVITQEQVRFQYDFVGHRDPAGRMVDTQEFENLRFKKKRFSEVLLKEFAQAGRTNVTITEEYVIIGHVYVQRKVVPLPLYLQAERDPEAIRRVLIDFGYFLKDIAASGIFPCDLFNTWNYGVTLWGRVVLYDYDDVLPLEKIRFREKPDPRNEYEEMEPEENWIMATEEDFFMDELDRYSGIPQPLRGIFRAAHGDLFNLAFWDDLTQRVKKGEVFDVMPYDRRRRFEERKGILI
jgi:isocitrate dehydrogenase kinase/phosphatase